MLAFAGDGVFEERDALAFGLRSIGRRNSRTVSTQSMQV
jgi:hypothetical protein